MTSNHDPVVEQIVDEYLRRLEQAAARLPADQRAELVLQIREHVDAACERDGSSEAAVRTILDRLGDPADIVAGESGEIPQPLAPPPVVTKPSPWGVLEVLAVVLLIAGSFVIPVVGPIAGLCCAWLSTRWTRGEKWVASLLFAPTVLLLLMVLAFPILMRAGMLF